MSFKSFCNICFIKENIIKLRMEENESILNILISFTSCPDIVNGIIYLCVNCYNKLEEYNKIREMFLMNFVRFRYLYNELKKQLEISKAPDIDTQLKAFVHANVKRPSGTPLIENYKAVQALRNNTEFNSDICKESDSEFIKIDFGVSLEKNDLSHVHTSFSSENDILESEKRTCYVKYENYRCNNEDQENIQGSSIYIKGEPSLHDEAYMESTNTDAVAPSISCFSSRVSDSSYLMAKQNFCEIENTNLKRDEPNPDPFEESHDPLMSDTFGNIIPCHESGDNGGFDVLVNPKDCLTDYSTNEEGSIDNENKATNDAECNVCDKRFSCNSDLEEHLRTYTGAKPINCNKCHKTFTDTAKLKRHKRLHSGKRRKKCGECGLRFTQLSHLSEHKRTHTGEKPYKCEYCDLGFRHGSYLKRHKLTHTGERPYSCDVCQKTFRQSGTLITHKRIHSGEKPYKCDECGMEFAQASSIRRHKFTHTSERPYSCDECHKTFKLNYQLTKHKQTHNRERPYKCDGCSSKFSSASDLKRHKLTHTG